LASFCWLRDNTFGGLKIVDISEFLYYNFL